MQLKRLEMLGFKSFADKTTVTFQPGVTAIVGPNGCGKSNISDAIRWVLGEQSAKHLRGDKMEDVIFNGTDNRKPLGMAEVSVTLTDVAGRLPSGFGDYQEIEITRRLFRSGESEYFINKIPCRLKDIRDLMMDAGVGAKIHAIIEQEKVDQILSSKPQDRRFLFEEVAGVMKYKARRQESLSKLESTQQNQVRVNDILTEVKRQLNSLDRQAKKAERYQKLRAEMKDLDLRLTAVEYSNLGIEWASASEEFKSLENEISELHARLGQIESRIEETRADALSKERELAALRHKLHETEAAISRMEHHIEMSKSQIAALNEQRARDIADIEYLRKEITRSVEQKTALEAEAQAIASRIEEKNRVLSEKTAVFERLQQSLREKEMELEKVRAGAISAMNNSAAEKTKMSNLQARLSQLDEEDEKGRIEAERLAAAVTDLLSSLSSKEASLSEAKSKKDAVERELAQVVDRLNKETVRKKGLDEARVSARHRLAEKSSRLRSLLELEQRLEGYQKGVRTVMSARKEAAADRLGAIHGLVADMIETDPMYETAIEAVLGDRLQYVVVDSQSDSIKAIDFLKSKGGGRGTFVPRSLREIKTEPFVKNGHSGVIGAALDVVRCKEDYKSIAQYLLSDVVVVDTLDTALHLWHNNGFHKTLVTLSGDIVDPWGAVTGGAVDSSGPGMLTKRREIKDLEKDVAELGAVISNLDTEAQELDAAIENGRKIEERLKAEIHTAELSIVNMEKDSSALKDEIDRTRDRITALETEASVRSGKRNSLAVELEQAKKAVEGIEEGWTRAQQSIEAMQRELSDKRAELESSRAEITELRMAVTAMQEKYDAIGRSLSSISRAEGELSERIKKKESEVSAIASRLVELESSISEDEEGIRETMKALEAERTLLVSRQEEHAETAAALQSLDEESRGIHHELEAAQKRMSANEVKRTELRMKIEHLKENIRTSYHTDLETIVTGLGELEINIEEAKARLDELRQKIDQMGPINVDALQEYAELKERHDLLSGQLNDINESIDNLKKTIAKLDEETKDLFMNAFHSIHEKFKDVFSLLFDGGKAELVLLDESNILESGIEIVAQPRGKKLQSISLLSGGERALTAIALLFAAFLVKPSPFCLLDEVDAPLDEANVTRFTRLLKEMSSCSQFIVITHNKRTMETADALYGITMEEPGCSKVMSVRFREAAMA